MKHDKKEIIKELDLMSRIGTGWSTYKVDNLKLIELIYQIMVNRKCDKKTALKFFAKNFETTPKLPE